MKFVVEALGLVAAGGKQLCLDFLARLPEHKDHEFVLVLPDLPEYGNVAGRNLKPIFYGRAGLLRRYVILNRVIPRICLRERADALLCLGNFAPGRPPCPTVVLLQNAWLVYRDHTAESRLTFPERLIVAYGRHSLRTLSAQVRVVVQTEVMRERLLSAYNLHRQNVNIVPNALFLPSDGDGDLGRLTSGPGRTFNFLCLTRYYAHKNLEVLVEAVKKLPAYTSRPFKCVISISAEQHPGARKLLMRIARDRLENVLVNIGPVPLGKLAEAYRSADALVLPTLLESFSRTYLEAMHFGLPILTSDRDFARARCEDAAVYFDPLDADSVANAMASVMEDAELRGRLVANGTRVLKQSPGWGQIAARIISVLEYAAKGLPLQPIAEATIVGAEKAM